MRIESTHARTWLAATVAGWALVVWGLSLAGLGSRIADADDVGEEGAPVPAAIPAPTAPPPLSAYGEVAARPLFSADRRPHPFFIDPADDGDGASNGFDYVLTSVLRTPDFAMAILQPNGGGDSIRLRIGDAPPDASNWVLESVDTRSVVFAGPEGPRTLELRVFDGVGGQPPTPMRPPVTDAGSGGQTAQSRTRAGGAPDVAAVPGAPPQATPERTRGSGATRAAAAQAPSATASEPASTGEAGAAPDAQVEAIRRRIEARRARLQQERAAGGTETP